MTPLKDQNVREGEKATFDCELSVEGATVKWFHEGQEVKEDKRHQILVNGKKHSLVISDAIMPDIGVVMAKVEDKTTKANLKVTGKTASHTLCNQLMPLYLTFNA